MVHIRTKSVRHWETVPRDTSKKALHKYCKLPKLTPRKGCEQAAICLCDILPYTCWYFRDTKLSGSLFLYEPLFLAAKIMEIFYTPKYFIK